MSTNDKLSIIKGIVSSINEDILKLASLDYPEGGVINKLEEIAVLLRMDVRKIEFSK